MTHSVHTEGKGNRLSLEKSPYLLQHATNPVNWFPWGEEAFLKARHEDKPIFLSVGYATCHWCHVMAHECFEDQSIARLLNQFFVSIKVDREEHPQVDHIYMSACQILSGAGGWPLSVFLTPEGEPFFAGTYFPKVRRSGLPGFGELLLKIANLWSKDRGKILQVASQVTSAIRKGAQVVENEEALSEGILRKAYEGLARSYDTRFGGFGCAPKFPTPHQLMFLLRWYLRSGQKLALEMVEHTLDAMRRGGIFDQIGFGFHRYSVDERWLVPHFEKMLYDQALLILAYAEAFQATGKPPYAQVARHTARYVLEDLRGDHGAFLCAEDADSEGREGAFYLWRPQEVRSLLGDELGELLCRFYGITAEGNFEQGASIPHLAMDETSLARSLGLEKDELTGRVEKGRTLLMRARSFRPRPLKDDKVLCGWNGLIIAALARSSWALGETSYAEAAALAARFVLGNMRSSSGHLLRRWREGQGAHEACLEDYAAMVWGLTELYQATFQVDWLKEALELNKIMLDLFWDHEKGGLFFTSDRAQALIARPKEGYDGAIPSGNSMAALNLARLARISGDPEMERRAWAILESFSGDMAARPEAHAHMLMALDLLLGPSQELVIAGDPCDPITGSMLRLAREGFAPNRSVILYSGGEEGSRLRDLAPWVSNMELGKSSPVAYLCRGFSCLKPCFHLEELRQALEGTEA